ncbi:MAG TPA: methionine adenosyltransferase [Candidatus Cryosericum sp.]|nr:methionine adenosyltransferase [Candidatus Cryosericum sp.]HPS69759.1 methionine adenosyltransferase [Candidatus Cryosericum sp.]
MDKSARTSQTVEFVTVGHPDKVADQISDAILDQLLTDDRYSRVACETFVTHGLVIVGGEITTHAFVDVDGIVRSTISSIGYNDPKYGFDAKTCAVVNAIGRQSPDIAQGVDIGGAGDQGIMYGYATDETPEYMPLPYVLARRLTVQQEAVRRQNVLDYLGPDGKSQVTLEYDGDKPVYLRSVVLSSQHLDTVLDPANPSQMSEHARQEIIEKIVRPVLPSELLDDKTTIFVNPTGKFVVGGPQSDTGMTGRKLGIDTYGGRIPHGGGAFSGKDPTKVDRSATYLMRYLAKNIVAAGIAHRCLTQIAYVIGQKNPVSFEVFFEGTGSMPESVVRDVIAQNIDMTPMAIIDYLGLRKPIYRGTSMHGHFGLPGFSWEELDLVRELKNWLKL